MNSETDQVLRKWQDRIRIVPAAYRWLAFAIAAVQIYLFTLPYYSYISPYILLIAVGIYTLFMMPYIFRWRFNRIITFSVLTIDIITSFFLILFTGAIYSPFILYTLVPVVTSALLLELGFTIGIATLTGAYVIGSHFMNPFFPMQLSPSELTYVLVYLIALYLTALLPYLINANLRQRLELGDIIRERKRLSREIHDGVAQAVFSLNWQVQLVDRRLEKMDIRLPEVRELVRLAAEAHNDTRQCLEILRSYSGNGSFVPHLKAYLSQLVQNYGLNIEIDTGTGNVQHEVWTELEMFRICQEALINVRKHAQARNVRIKFRSSRNRLYMNILDDGCGFDTVSYFRDSTNENGRHGLAIMRERADALGGKLRISSMPGQGTEVQVEIPVNQRKGRLQWLNL